jgi:hypothetical protein
MLHLQLLFHQLVALLELIKRQQDDNEDDEDNHNKQQQQDMQQAAPSNPAAAAAAAASGHAAAAGPAGAGTSSAASAFAGSARSAMRQLEDAVDNAVTASAVGLIFNCRPIVDSAYTHQLHEGSVPVVAPQCELLLCLMLCYC